MTKNVKMAAIIHFYSFHKPESETPANAIY